MGRFGLFGPAVRVPGSVRFTTLNQVAEVGW